MDGQSKIEVQSAKPGTEAVLKMFADQRQAWRRGRHIPVEAYLGQHPWLDEDEDALLDLIYNEIVLREEAGECALADEFALRFPNLEEELQTLFAVHAAVASDAPAVPMCGLADSRASHNGVTPRTDSQDTAVASRISDPSHGQSNTSIGSYEVLEEIGRGGMGIVYKARQPGTQRLVALKVILTGRFASEDEIARFYSEAQAAARLEHPGIVPIYEVGRAGDLYYLSMAYVEGETLATVLARGPFSPDRAAKVALDVAAAADTAHRHGIIHRDLKPQNVLIDRAGRVRITDFGLARHVDRLCSVTSTGQVVGTPQYMPPEQAAGRHGQVGPATDVYALGATLYCTLTGRPPFDGAVALEVLGRVMLDEPVSPRVLNPAVGRDLETICLKCLEKEPHKRYASAQELAEDLRRYLAGEPILARPVGRIGRLWRWSRRKPLIAGLSASIVLLAAALLVGSFVAVVRLRDENTRTARNLTRAVEAEELANRRLLESLLAQIRSGRRSGRAGQRIQSLAAAADAARLVRELEYDPDVVLTLRNEAAACMALTDVGPPERYDAPIPHGACFDRHSERYAAWDPARRVIRVVDHHKGKELFHWDVQAEDVATIRFSSDGGYLGALATAAGRSRIYVWKTDQSESPPVAIELTTGRVADFDIALGGRAAAGSLVLASPHGRLKIYSLREGGTFQYALDTGGGATGCRFGPHGRKVAVCDGGEVRIVDLDRRSVSRPLRHHADVQIQGCAFSGDGRLLVTTGSDHLAVVWNVWDEPARRCVLSGHEGWVREAAFHPDADLLVTSSKSEGRTRLWDPWRGSLLVTFEGVARGFSSDGDKLIGTMGQQLAVWPLAQNRVSRRLHATLVDWSALSGQFSQSGRLLFTFGWDQFKLWDFLRGDELVCQPLSSAFGGGMAADGDYVVTSTNAGVQRWRLRRGDGPGVAQPPESIPIPLAIECLQHLCTAPNGAFAVAGHGRATVFAASGSGWNTGSSARPRASGSEVREAYQYTQTPRHGPVVTHGVADRCAISPDGRWLATFGLDAAGVRVWDSVSGDLLYELGTKHTNALAAFSPCGRWLFAGGEGEFGFWSLDGFEFSHPASAIRRSVVYAAFSQDGRMLAASDRQRRLTIVDVASGRRLVTLPTEHFATYPCFNQDGTQLVCMNQRTGARVWDLRQLQRELAELGLGWN